MIAHAREAPAVSDGLLDYFRRQLNVNDLEYRHRPRQIPNGRETYTFHFQLDSCEQLPAGLRGPLILRLYSSVHGLDTLRHDYAVQEHMVRLDYPVPRPLLLEEDCAYFGGPFMVMQFVHGQNLLDLLFELPWRILDVAKKMATWHRQLHQLPAAGFPTHPDSYLERKLNEVQAWVEDHGLVGVRPGLEWLRRHRPPDPVTPHILHLDFHPMNLILEDAQHYVLDWADSDVGDRHADVAATLVLIRAAPVDIPYLWQRLLHRGGRLLLERLYLRFYKQHLALDRQLLAYYLALTSLRRLGRWGLWLSAGPGITGSKPSSLRFWNRREARVLERCFFDQSGVRVHL